VAPETVREHGVRIGGAVYPVKQAFEVALGVRRTKFTSHTALRHLTALGFAVTAATPIRIAAQPQALPQPETREQAQPRGWPWEGAVQSVFANLLVTHGWTISSMADTATKQAGIDMLAAHPHAGRRLGAEVKGWPSVGYADPRRAGEIKKTQPSTQAGHWFSDALRAAMMLLDSHPGHESLMVLPDHTRYRDLAARTATGRRAANIHVVLLQADGSYTTTMGWRP
jgi:hypothetical protein